MYIDPPLTREVEIIDSASPLRLEERACDFSLKQRLDPVNQRLDPAWVQANAAPGGAHYLWPALWENLPHRPELPPQLRCAYQPRDGRDWWIIDGAGRNVASFDAADLAR